MGITRPCYARREDVKLALDSLDAARSNALIDVQVEAASITVDTRLHRRFYPVVTTCYFDWPNYQYAYPWRLWLDAKELADKTTAVLTTGGQVIPANTIFFEPVNEGPPFTYLELNRSSTSAFGVSTTPQHDIAISGSFGYDLNTAAAGALAAAMNDTTTGTAVVTNGAAVGVGDLIVCGTERMLVTDRAMVSTTVTLVGNLTATVANTLVGVADITKFGVGETILIDAERMLIVDAAGTNLVVKRAWDGTVLAAHTGGATIYASRQLTVTRGAYGTTAATHLLAAAVTVHTPPALVRQTATAEAVVNLIGVRAGYPAKVSTFNPGPADVSELWDQVWTAYGRKARQRVV